MFTDDMAKDKIDQLIDVVKLSFANLDSRMTRGFAAVAEDIHLNHTIMAVCARAPTAASYHCATSSATSTQH